MSPFPYDRIVVVGTTGSGKSSLAKQIADQFGHNFIELDALHWEPGWQEAPNELFRARVEQATQAEKWSVAGNYRAVRDLLWPKADAVIWLDYPLPFTFVRLWKRTWRRGWSQEELWNGNRDTFLKHLKLWSKESLFHWLFATYWRRKREFALLLSLPEYQHLKVIHLKTQKETDAWLKTFQ